MIVLYVYIVRICGWLVVVGWCDCDCVLMCVMLCMMMCDCDCDVNVDV